MEQHNDVFSIDTVRLCQNSRTNQNIIFKKQCEIQKVPVKVRLGTYSKPTKWAVRTGPELLSTNLELGTRLGRARCRGRDDQAVRDAADAKLAKMRSDAEVVDGMQKRQMASNVSRQGLTADLKTVQVRFFQVTVETPELSTKLDAAAADSNKRLEELGGVRGTRDRVGGLVRYIVDLSVGALDALLDLVDVRLMDRSCTAL